MRQATFRAIAFREGQEWVAHCLDLDIVSSGRTRDEAVDALVEALGLQLAHARETDNYEYLFRPAPESAWQRLAEIMKGPHETLLRSIDDADDGHNLLETQLAA
ncbi:MAG TPA: hypothetical protein VNK50_05615 [Calidithermus sp.]|nr:hypothetical protein [Calidithermus sp.]